MAGIAEVKWYGKIDFEAVPVRRAPDEIQDQSLSLNIVLLGTVALRHPQIFIIAAFLVCFLGVDPQLC